MNARFSPAWALSLLLTACSVDSGCHARLFRLTDTLPSFHPLAPYDTPVCNDEVCPPATDHASFTCHPAYPHTLQVWKDEVKMQVEGPRRVEIDLARQRGIFVVNEEVVMDFPVCTGTKRKPTPTGRFRISQKDVHHHSNIYDVPMPYFMRLTNGGIGLHVGDVFRSPASHGCIRLTREACVPLFHHAPSGTLVVIRHRGWAHEASSPGEGEAHTLQLANAAG